MPDPSILPNPRGTNPEFNDFPRAHPTDPTVHRGYMRLLHRTFEYASEFAGVTLDASSLASKLKFQFNPNQLTRQVNARTDTQLWINQSPTQLLQPAIGDMTFGWTMLFNREAEVSRNTPSGNSRIVEWEDPELDALIDPSQSRLYDPETVAQRLGVLADIAILDRITGQSITKEAVDYARNRHDVTAEAGLSEEEDPVDTDNFLIEVAERAGIGREGLISANAHNSAFLIPNPIRAVFSENFMVDGYVNSVTVSFQKFSPDMIPTVAIVDVSMHAIYQGFARKKTIFTDLLRLQASEESGEIEPGGDALSISQAAPDLSHAANLQEIGRRHPRVLSGFDHSPPQPDDWGDTLGDFKDAVLELDFSALDWGDNNIPSEPYTRLSKHKKIEGSSNHFKMEGGISFAPVSYYGEGTRGTIGGYAHESLGRHLSRNVGTSNDYMSRLSAETHVGLSLRARLKAANKADLNLLVGGNELGMNASIDTGTAQAGTTSSITLKSGSSGSNDYYNGMILTITSGTGSGQSASITDYNGTTKVATASFAPAPASDSVYSIVAPYTTSSAFFVDWPDNMRRELFATGLDNCKVYGTERDELFQEFAITGNLYTRSFPLIELPGAAPGETRYGDQLDMRSFPYTDVRIPGNEGAWIYCADYLANKWQEDDTEYALAAGFYSGDVPFPETLTITRQGGAALEFDVEYQMRLLFRTFLRYREPTNDQSYTVSDTGWLAIHPRDANTQLLKEGDTYGWWGESMDENLNGDLAGVNAGTGLDSTYPWFLSSSSGPSETNLHFDGQLDGAKDGASGTTQWRTDVDLHTELDASINRAAGDPASDSRWITRDGIVT